MKRFLSMTLFSMMLLLSACSASGNKTVSVANSGENPTLESDPKAFLQDLPTSFTSQFPLHRPVANTTRLFYINAANFTEFYGSMVDDVAVEATGYDTSKITAKLRPLFNIQGLHGIARYKGTLTTKNNTTDKGDTSDPLYNKLFTYQAGNQLITFGYFDDNGTTKIYSYDPDTNKLTDFEFSFSPLLGVERYEYDNTADVNVQWRIALRK